MIPVYPLFGVTVTVEVPELPAETATFVAVNVKDLPDEPTVKINVPVDGA
jgi:hypothetical protein